MSLASSAAPKKLATPLQSCVESPRKSSINHVCVGDDNNDFGEPTDSKSDKLLLFADTAQVPHTTAAPSAPPLAEDERNASAPPTIQSPQTAVVFVPTGDDMEPPAAIATRLHKSMAVKTGEWEVGIWSCCTVCVPVWVMASFCPCIVQAQITARLGLKPYWHSLGLFIVVFFLEYGLTAVWSPNVIAAIRHNESLRVNTVVYCVLSVITSAIDLVVLYHLRRTIRTHFQIPGSSCGDCCAVLCANCAVTQMATHLRVYQPGSFDFGPVDVLPAFDNS